MLLILTNSQDVTADYLVSVLDRASVPLIRLNTDTLITQTFISYRPGEPIISLDGVSYPPSDVQNVWYRRPQPLRSNQFDDSSDSHYILNEWAEGIEGFLAHIPKMRWMNHPSSNALASHKLEQLTTARSLGFQLPDSLVTQDESILREFFRQNDGQIVVKPMANGYIERPLEDTDSQIYTNRVRESDLRDLTDLKSCPTFFQQFIQKKSDVRITIVDDEIHTVELVGKDNGVQRCDIRRNNMADVAYSKIDLPESVRAKLRRLMDHYSLRFAAIDMVIADDGEWFFLEVNPNGQWAWLDLEGVTGIAQSFVTASSTFEGQV